jgi:hypothetical protein
MGICPGRTVRAVDDGASKAGLDNGQTGPKPLAADYQGLHFVGVAGSIEPIADVAKFGVQGSPKLAQGAVHFRFLRKAKVERSCN